MTLRRLIRAVSGNCYSLIWTRQFPVPKCVQITEGTNKRYTIKAVEKFSAVTLARKIENSLYFSLLAGKSTGERFALDTIHRQRVFLSRFRSFFCSKSRHLAAKSQILLKSENRVERINRSGNAPLSLLRWVEVRFFDINRTASLASRLVPFRLLRTASRKFYRTPASESFLFSFRSCFLRVWPRERSFW